MSHDSWVFWFIYVTGAIAGFAPLLAAWFDEEFHDEFVEDDKFGL